jgi:uncharacterized membrane protein YbaN (DUF454 family)
MKNIVFKILGLLFVAIGFIGIFLPLLPTTIFLIIASYFFMKGSPELNEWMMKNKYLGPYVRNFREKKGMTAKSKIGAISMLWFTILISAIFFTDHLLVRLLLLSVAIGVTIYIANYKTLRTQSVHDSA